jgi:signal transduction histidine kinase
VIGRADVLLEEVFGPLNAGQKDSVQTIERSGRHLLELINDILDLSKLEAKTVELEWEDCNAAEITGETLRFISSQARHKNIEVCCEIEPDLPGLTADSRRLKQMLINLLGNAVKFTSEGGRIGLSVRHNRESKEIEFTVWDTGIGISAVDQMKLFQPFVQIDGGLNRKYEGTGLGLVLVRRTARLHGGDVSVRSAEGEGSRFTLRLPIWQGKSGEGNA